MLACCFSVLLLSAPACCGQQAAPTAQEKRLVVVTTLFPLYDFARTVAGTKADVALLLPPGVEPHSFEPKPGDFVKIHKADIFIYTGDFMEPWAAVLIKGAERPGLVVVDSSRNVFLARQANGQKHSGEHPEQGAAGRTQAIDPHIWLDLGNAQIMVDNIAAGFVQKDPENKTFYEKNAQGLKARLRELDEQFRSGLASCRTRLFVHGGHYAFNYLARRYGLTYFSVYGVTPDAEPSPKHVAEIVGEIRRHQIRYIFYEELLQPRMAETISRETGAQMLPLNGGHNVTKQEFEQGVTFISILQRDLKNLKVGLQCQ